MDERLFAIDPYAGIGYGMYNALKKGEGNFEDFLLQYNSHEANEGDSSWLTKIMQKDMSNALSSPEVWSAMDTLGINSLDFISTSDYFETQVQGYRFILMQEMHKRGERVSEHLYM